MIVAVAGNPSIDKLFEVERLCVGQIHRPQRFVQLPGGKGIHVAQVATALGAEAITAGLLGGHSGRWVADSLAAQGVDGRFVWMAGETRSSLSVADQQTHGLTEFYEDGTPLTEDEWRALESVVLDLLSQASWITLAGSLPSGAPEDGYARLLAHARRAGVSVALDTRAEALKRTIDEGPQLVKINLDEAGELLGRTLTGVEEAAQAASEIRALAGGQGRAAAVTAGEQGVAMADSEGNVWRGALAARGRYPVGSGDSFLAGMLVAREQRAPWPDSIALALGAAAANAEVPGAGKLDPERARHLATRAEVIRL